MSFQDAFHDLEAAGLPPRTPPPPPPRRRHRPWWRTACSRSTPRCPRSADELACGGRGGDAFDVRERIRRARAEAAVGPRLAMDFQAALREFQWVQGRIIEADRQETAAAAARHARAPPMFRPPSPPSYGSSQLNNAAAGPGTRGADQQRDIQMQQQQLVESRRTQELTLLDNEITFNEALIEEREREICKIQQEISEINEIFRDLAKLVHDQQGAIDVVESNIKTAAMETSKGEEELSRAAQTQESNSSMKCLLVTVLGFLMLIFALVFIA
ncbi:syntaxin-22-like [Panicum miliaceum]|uniref:Syntaxin-22-like n=1 Tax=Panicum miliaceum TaxID=4540 RepID=A0A3L6PBK0_PANMI|nr:syntaxin-22-like [Panicum miliaceum]